RGDARSLREQWHGLHGRYDRLGAGPRRPRALRGPHHAQRDRAAGPRMTKIVGIISDTHGLLRPEAKAALEGCDAIVHAGDIGKPDVLGALEAIAPVTAIRGNVDKWADTLPDAAAVEIEGRWLYVIHDVNTLDLDPRAA